MLVVTIAGKWDNPKYILTIPFVHCKFNFIQGVAFFLNQN